MPTTSYHPFCYYHIVTIGISHSKYFIVFVHVSYRSIFNTAARTSLLCSIASYLTPSKPKFLKQCAKPYTTRVSALPPSHYSLLLLLSHSSHSKHWASFLFLNISNIYPMQWPSHELLSLECSSCPYLYDSVSPPEGL